ncbi:DMT family transporter [Bartonella sp. HY038]|uniref:aromatic amino acid exporter YddG n=1 Tax=Bartonella sp. HY038 TaxID=2759660 RepID=UPI0015FCBDFD|nr:EamA family transporter [Bartonella sp. HY038]
MSSKATIIGLLAILMWAIMVTLTAYTGAVPPFLLTAIALFIGSLPAILKLILHPQNLKLLKQPLIIWLIGIGGLFGHHFFYFTALRNAPPAEAGLINYLWPLLIVLGTAFMPNEKLRWFHIGGVILGFCGTILVVSKSGGLGFDSRYGLGYLAAICSATIWASYSLLARRFNRIPTLLVGGFCFISAILSLICHFIFGEANILPRGLTQWSAMIALGLFPVGLAFYCWDYGIKNGNIQVLGTTSYATPLLSTLLLVLFGITEPNWKILAACILITCGAVLASKDIIFKKRKRESNK